MQALKSIYRSFFPAAASEEDMARVKGLVEGMITGSSPIAVFSKSYCPYCHRAKALLGDLKQQGNMKVLELDQHKDGAAIQQYLAARVKASRVTVPQIYIKGELVGGCSELQSLHSAGKLEPLLTT